MRAETFSDAHCLGQRPRHRLRLGARWAARRSPHRSSSSSTVCTPSSPASRIRWAVASAWSPAVAPPKRASRRPEPSCQAASSESASSGSRASRDRGLLEHVGIVGGAHSGGVPDRLGMQSHGHRHDQPERPVGAREQLGEVVARDVLDHLAAGLGEAAVRERERDADDQIAHAAVAVAQRAGVAGRDHAADGRRVARPQRRVEREHLALRGEGGLRLAQRHARLQHRGQIADVVLEDLRHPAGLELDRDGLADPAPVELRAAAAHAHGLARLAERAQQLGGLLRRAGALGGHSQLVATPQNLSASPAASSGWIR